MKSLSVLLLLLCIASCTRVRKSDELAFAFDACIKLREGEQQLMLDKKLADIYTRSCDVAGIDIPLNKAVRTSEYLFVGLTPGISPEEFDRKQRSDPSYSLISGKSSSVDGKNLRQYFLKKNNLYNFRSIYNDSLSGNLVILNFLDSDSARLAAQYNDKTYLQKRFTCE